MNPVLLRLLASLKIPACIAIGCGGTLTVQRYTTSSSSSWDEKAATEKEGSGKGMKFEINQLSKQLEEKEQSLKTWEEMLSKQAADLKEQQAAVSSAPARTTVVTTVAEPKPDQPIIDDVPFGEEDAKPGKLKASNIAQRGNYKERSEVPTDSVPKRPAVFDGGGTPAVAFPPTTDVVTVERQGDVPEMLRAELRAKDRALEVLREQREEARKEKEADLAKYEEELRRLDREKNALEAELEEKDRRLTKLNASNEDLKRELDETMRKLAKAEAGAKEKVRQLEQLGFLVQMADEMRKEKNGRLKTVKAAELQAEGDKRLSLAGTIIPKDGSFAVCKLKPKEASSSPLWWLCYPLKWAYNACLDNQRKVLVNNMTRDKKVSLSDVNKCFALEPTALYVCATSEPEDGLIVKKGKDRYSVRKPERWWFWLFCPCKRKANEIRKLKYEEAVIEVMSEEPQDSVKIPELFDVLSTEEQEQFKKLLPEINNGKSFVSLENEACDEDHGVYASYEELGEPEVGNKYRTIFFVFEPCFWLWDKARSAFFGK